MGEKFIRPDFIDTKIKPTPLKNGEYGEGFAVRVAKLEGFPNEIESVPHGYVIKKYKFGESDERWREMFPHDEQLKKTARNLTLLDVARKLKHNEDTLRQYFSDSLPDLIVPSQYIVGSETEKKWFKSAKPKKKLYNIQKEISPSVVLNDQDISLIHQAIKAKQFGGVSPENEKSADFTLDISARGIARMIRDNNPENFVLIKEQINILVEKAKNLVAETKFIYIDLFEFHNMLITKDGLRAIDTNQSMPYLKDTSDTERDPAVYKAIFDGYVNFWDEVAKKL